MIFKQIIRSKFKRPFVLYPFLFIILFILKKFRIPEVNPHLTDILFFLLLNSTILILLFLCLNFLIKNRLKIWLIVTFILSIILYYAKLEELISNLPIENLVHGRQLVRFILISLSGLALVLLFSRYKGDLMKISQYLNVLMVLLIVYQLYSISRMNTKKISLANQININANIPDKNTNRPPDIYYIILDAYTSSQSLKDYWNYDNDSITNFLIQKGFFIAKKSRSNYNQTIHSLASSLNMSYLKSINQASVTKIQEKNLFNLAKESSVTRIFLKNNYKIFNYSFFDIPENPKYYKDLFFLIREDLYDGTFYQTVMEKFHWAKDPNSGMFVIKKTNLDILNKLEKRNEDSEKPRFVYAHIIMPHNPYFFDQNGKTQDKDSIFNFSSKNSYLEQLKYLNKLVERTISSIFENSSGKLPVIIIQGDHGFRYLPGKNALSESSTIFNAYFFPDHDYQQIYPAISPVNTFRIVFNKYLNYKFPLLKDTTYNVFVF